MTPTTTLTPPRNDRAPTARRTLCAARFAEYRAPDEPPVVRDVCGDEATVIEDLFALAAQACVLPPIAVREVVENLIHAGFDGACVSVMDHGAVLRVSDCGPGIHDKDLALLPGFSTACGSVRDVVRGVGSGLPVATNAMTATGGTLELTDNLGGGTVVTLSATGSRSATDVSVAAELSEHARRAMALLVEVGPAAPATIARELGISLGDCGRELVVLEHRRLVDRGADGTRTLTDTGSQLLSTLF